MRVLLALLLVGMIGCASLPEAAKPEPQFTKIEPVDTSKRSPRPAELPAIEAPTLLTRVTDPSDCRTMTCYAAPAGVTDPELGGYTAPQLEDLQTHIELAEANFDLANAHASSLDERKLEINHYLQLGRITEQQQEIQVQHYEFVRAQYLQEWWTTRIAIALVLISAGAAAF